MCSVFMAVSNVSYKVHSRTFLPASFIIISINVFTHIGNIIISLSLLHVSNSKRHVIQYFKLQSTEEETFPSSCFRKESRFFPVRSHGWYKIFLWYVTYTTSAWHTTSHSFSWRLLWHDMKILIPLPFFFVCIPLSSVVSFISYVTNKLGKVYSVCRLKHACFFRNHDLDTEKLDFFLVFPPFYRIKNSLSSSTLILTLSLLSTLL